MELEEKQYKVVLSERDLRTIGSLLDFATTVLHEDIHKDEISEFMQHFDYDNAEYLLETTTNWSAL